MRFSLRWMVWLQQTNWRDAVVGNFRLIWAALVLFLAVGPASAAVGGVCGSSLTQRSIVADGVCVWPNGEALAYTCNAPKGKYVSFASACTAHDACYGALGRKKSGCDADFYRDLRDACRTALDAGFPEAGRKACYGYALLYNDAVRVKGCDAFRDAQKQAGQQNASCDDGDTVTTPSGCQVVVGRGERIVDWKGKCINGVADGIGVTGSEGNGQKLAWKGLFRGGLRSGLWLSFATGVVDGQTKSSAIVWRSDSGILTLVFPLGRDESIDSSSLRRLREAVAKVGDQPTLPVAELLADIGRWQSDPNWTFAQLKVPEGLPLLAGTVPDSVPPRGSALEQVRTGGGPLPPISSGTQGIQTEWHFIGLGHSNARYLTDKCDLLTMGLRKELPRQLVLVFPNETDLSSRSVVESLIGPAIERFRDGCNIAEVKKRTLSLSPTKVHATVWLGRQDQKSQIGSMDSSNAWVRCTTNLDAGAQLCDVEYFNGLEFQKQQAAAQKAAQERVAADLRAQQQASLQQQQAEARANAANDLKAQALADKFRVDGWIPWPAVTANPYAHEGKVYMLNTVFERMVSPDTAQFGDGMLRQAILVTGVPKTSFTEQKSVVVVGRVVEPDRNGQTLRFKYLGHEFCVTQRCSDFGSVRGAR